MRTFIAIDLDEDIRLTLGELRERLPSRDSAIRWVRPAAIHLTLKFLGEIKPETIPDVTTAMASACADIRPFGFRVQGIGCFPGVRNPRVVWAGVEPADGPLLTLQQNLEDELHELGMKRERRLFRPHLTLARIKGRMRSFPLNELADQGPDEIGEQDVSEIILFQSELKPSGAVYVPLARVPLEGADT